MAFVVLWGLPGETADLWAWTIKPEMTPIFMGSAYGAGAYFFSRVFRANRWHTASAGVFSVAIFAGLMLVVTLIHWHKFNHGDAPFLAAAAFYGRVGVYIVSPPAVAWLWAHNQRTDARTAAACGRAGGIDRGCLRPNSRAAVASAVPSLRRSFRGTYLGRIAVRPR